PPGRADVHRAAGRDREDGALAVRLAHVRGLAALVPRARVLRLQARRELERGAREAARARRGGRSGGRARPRLRALAPHPCEPECPNTAIYQGGVEWQAPDGAMHPAISNDIFYIVPEKCTECVGFYDHEACAAVCPVDCCVPDPARPESETALLQRARELHP